MLFKNCVFQCTSEIVCVEFQRYRGVPFQIPHKISCPYTERLQTLCPIFSHACDIRITVTALSDVPQGYLPNFCWIWKHTRANYSLGDTVTFQFLSPRVKELTNQPVFHHDPTTLSELRLLMKVQASLKCFCKFPNFNSCQISTIKNKNIQ